MQVGVSSVLVSFDLSGNIQELTDFLTTVRGYAPISSLNEVSIGAGNDETTPTKLTFEVYYSPLPTEILSFKEAEAKLTDSENNVLETASSLIPPKTLDITPQGSKERIDPF